MIYIKESEKMENFPNFFNYEFLSNEPTTDNSAVDFYIPKINSVSSSSAENQIDSTCINMAEISSTNDRFQQNYFHSNNQ